CSDSAAASPRGKSREHSTTAPSSLPGIAPERTQRRRHTQSDSALTTPHRPNADPIAPPAATQSPQTCRRPRCILSSARASSLLPDTRAAAEPQSPHPPPEPAKKHPPHSATQSYSTPNCIRQTPETPVPTGTTPLSPSTGMNTLLPHRRRTAR